MCQCNFFPCKRSVRKDRTGGAWSQSFLPPRCCVKSDDFRLFLMKTSSKSDSMTTNERWTYRNNSNEKKHQMNFGNKVQRFYHDHAALHSCAMWNMCIHFSWEIICFSWHYCIQSDTFKFALNILENSQNRSFNRNSKLFCVIKHHKL